jgi:MFS family permease
MPLAKYSFLLLWGRLGDIYGKRNMFIYGSVWVAITTAINPFLPNEIVFDLFRGLQGLVSTSQPASQPATLTRAPERQYRVRQLT